MDQKECLICGTTYGLERHHIFGGTSNRKNSEKYGLVCYLCADHHRGPSGVHQFRALDLAVKQRAQADFEETHTRDEFVRIFGKSWL